MANHYIVTGCAGFVGSTLIDRLLGDGHRVTSIVIFLSGQRHIIEIALTNPRFHLTEGNHPGSSGLSASFRGGECVIHFCGEC